MGPRDPYDPLDPTPGHRHALLQENLYSEMVFELSCYINTVHVTMCMFRNFTCCNS